jgi:hypothetical protein
MSSINSPPPGRGQTQGQQINHVHIQLRPEPQHPHQNKSISGQITESDELSIYGLALNVPETEQVIHATNESTSMAAR